jgi:hypothetical protein
MRAEVKEINGKSVQESFKFERNLKEKVDSAINIIQTKITEKLKKKVMKTDKSFDKESKNFNVMQLIIL